MIDIQNVSSVSTTPECAQIQKWAETALNVGYSQAELCIRIVDEPESTELNNAYRNKTGPTNVLSFPAEIPPDVELEIPYLGDIIICAPVLMREAQEQNKPLNSHWAHTIIHGILHLQGYDHVQDHEAEIMEQLEIKLLAQLGFANPYH